MATLVDHFDGPKTVPFSYPAGSNDVAFPSVINATFNGGGASGDFLACLDILSQDGKLLSRTFPDDAIPAGDTAEVTYAPFLRKRSTSSGGGIQFDVDNTGDWLHVFTTGDDGAGAGIVMTAAQFEEIRLNSVDTTFVVWSGEVSAKLDIVNGAFFSVQNEANGHNHFYVDEDETNLVGSARVTVEDTATFRVDLLAGGNLTVRDSANQPIFRVDENGDLHGKTGHALVFDL